MEVQFIGMKWMSMIEILHGNNMKWNKNEHDIRWKYMIYISAAVVVMIIYYITL